MYTEHCSRASPERVSQTRCVQAGVLTTTGGRNYPCCAYSLTFGIRTFSV